MTLSKAPGLFILLLILAACAEEGATDQVATVGSSSEPQFSGPGYGGVDSCVECHQERVESYRRTAHHNTLRRPDPVLFAERIEATGGRLETRDPALHFEFAVVDDQVFQESILELGSRTIRNQEEIAFIMGSGRIFEGYLAWQGDRLIQLPVGWIGDEQSWANCPGYPDGNAVFDREILPRCLDCHGTWAESRGGARFDPDSLIAGLSCERCHGPGRDHIEHHRAHPDDDQGRHVVRPAELTRARRLDLCAQCHAEPGQLIGEPFHYLPGTPLAEHVRQEGGHGSDVFVHTANQIQRLSSSACFKNSAELDCLSCHRTHKPEGKDLLRRSLRSCAGCHEDGHCGAAESLPEALRGDCLDCHMPERQVSDTVINTRDQDFLDFFRMTEHRIGVHLEATEKTRALHEIDAGAELEGRARLAALAVSLGRRATIKERAHRFLESMALLREAGRLDPAAAPSVAVLAELAAREHRRAEALAMLDDVREVIGAGRLASARTRIEAVLDLDPGQPEALVLLGEVARLSQDPVEAERRFTMALAARPDFVDASLALAGLQLAGNRPREALETTAGLVRDQPRLARAWLLRARGLAALGDFAAALEALDRYLEREPDDGVAGLNRAALLLELGRGEEALALAESLSSNPDPELQVACARFLQGLRRWDLVIELWRGLIDLPGYESSARAVLAGCAMDAGETTRAAEILRPLAGRNDDPEFMAAEARLARLENRLLEAEKIMQGALRIPGSGVQARLEAMRLLASLRIRDLDAILEQAGFVLAGPLGRDPEVLLEIAGHHVEQGNREAAKRLLDLAIERPETALIPGLRERIRLALARLDESLRDD